MEKNISIIPAPALIKIKPQIKVKSTIQIKLKPQSTPQPKPIVSCSSSAAMYPLSFDANQELTISFDVGIINLAYCILYLDACGISHIVDWDIINLASGDQKLLCSEKLKSGANNGKTCTKKAHYSTMVGRKQIGYCLIHGKNKNCDRNMTVANVTELELKSTLFKKLDDNPLFLKPRIVLIELQPLKAREKIKGISHSIFDYYVLRGMDNNCLYEELRFVDAKNKLTIYTGPAISCHLKSQYARNKWYGRQYCQWMLATDPDNIEHAEALTYYYNFTKKDDLADSFLQGVWYLLYGRYGKKAPVTSTLCATQYENNKIKYKKIQARIPTKKSIAAGRYTMANVKYLMGKNTSIDGVLRASIEFFFGDVNYFKDSVMC